MSVYTLLNQNQLRDILDKYELEHIESIKEIAEGIENSNYWVKTWKQDYVLTIFEQSDAASLNRFFQFMHYGEQQGFAFPCPITNKQGQYLSFFEYKGKRKHFIVCKKLSGSHPEAINETLCFELGKQFAGIHALSKNEAIVSLFPFNALAFVVPESSMDFLSADKKRTLESAKSLIAKLGSAKYHLPSGICHCDFFPDNALLIQEGNTIQFSGFLDWYDAQHTFFVLDLAIIAISWCRQSQSALDEKLVSALLNGYQQVRPLEQAERELWPEFLKVACMIFWLSRECYVQRMKEEGTLAKENKQPEEFFDLLLELDKG